jgi:hypothetical protein
VDIGHSQVVKKFRSHGCAVSGIIRKRDNSSGLTKKSRTYKISFFAIEISGVLLHFFAIYLTRMITFSGIGKEINPLYYSIGANYFRVFGFSVLIGYCGIQWLLLKIPNTYKIFGGSWLTTLATSSKVFFALD